VFKSNVPAVIRATGVINCLYESLSFFLIEEIESLICAFPRKTNNENVRVRSLDFMEFIKFQD